MTAKSNTKVEFHERRTSDRKSVSIGASAIIANSDATVDCTILDISDSGAKLELTDVEIIPARFKLFIPEVDHIYDCEVVWRDGNFLGLRFTNPKTL